MDEYVIYLIMSSFGLFEQGFVIIYGKIQRHGGSEVGDI